MDLKGLRDTIEWSKTEDIKSVPKMYVILRMMEEDPEKYPTTHPAVLDRLSHEWQCHRKMRAGGITGSMKEYQEWKQWAIFAMNVPLSDIEEPK